MRVQWYRSIKVKLFVLMLAIVGAAMWSISWQNLASFRAVLERQSEENAVALGRRSAASLATQLQSWTSLVSVAESVGGSVGVQFGPLQRLRIVQELVSSHPEIAAFQTFELPRSSKESPLELTFTLSKSRSHHAWLGKKLNVLEENVRNLGSGIATEFAKHPLKFTTVGGSIKSVLDASLIAVQVPFQIVREKKTVAAIALVYVWPDGFVSDLVRGGGVDSVVIKSSSGMLFDALGGTKEGALPEVSSFALDALWSGSIGFQTLQSRAADGSPLLTAWIRVGNSDLAVRIQKIMNVEKLQMDFQVRKLILWSILLFLVVLAVSYLAAVGISRRIRDVTALTTRIASGHFRSKIAPGTLDEVGVLSVSVNRMAEQLEKFVASRDEAVRRELELKTAEMIQRTLFPAAETKANGIHTRAIFRPATECAGDLWGRFDFEDGKTLLIIADATGHGASSALIAALAFSYFATVQKAVEQKTWVGDLSPMRLLEDLHSILWNSGKGLTTMSMLVVLADSSSKTLHFSGAGHPHPILYDAMGNVKGVRAPGSLLGMLEEASFSECRAILSPGDRLFLFTDGLFECENASGECLKPRSLKKILLGRIGDSSERFFDSVTLEIDSFFNGVTLTDDVTVLMMQVTSDWGGSPV